MPQPTIEIQAPNPPDFNPYLDTFSQDSIAKGASALGDTITDIVGKAQTEKFSEEARITEDKFRQDLLAQKGRIDDIIAQATDSSGGEETPAIVQEYIKRTKLRQLAQEQGTLSESELRIEQMNTLKRYMRRYPQYSDQFAAAANSVGGLSLVSEDIRAMIEERDALIAGDNKQNEAMDAFVKWGIESGRVNADLMYSDNPDDIRSGWKQLFDAQKDYTAEVTAKTKFDTQAAQTGVNNYDTQNYIRESMPNWYGDAFKSVQDNLEYVSGIRYDLFKLDSYVKGATGKLPEEQIQLIKTEVHNNLQKFILDKRAEITSMIVQRGGSVDGEMLNRELQPLQDLMKVVDETLGSGTLADNYDALIKVQRNHGMMVVGVNNVLAAELFEKLAPYINIQSDNTKYEIESVFNSVIRGLVSPGAFSPQSGNRVNPDGSINLEETTSFNQALSGMKGTTPDQVRAAEFRFYSEVNNMVNAVEPIQGTDVAAVSTVMQALDEYNRQLSRAKPQLRDPKIMDAALSIAANDKFIEFLDKQPPPVKEQFRDSANKMVVTEFDVLLNNIKMLGLEGFNEPYTSVWRPGGRPQYTGPVPVIEPAGTNPSGSDMYELVVDGDTVKFAIKSNAPLVEEGDATNNRQAILDNLNRKASPRMTLLVKSLANLFAAEKGSKKPDLQVTLNYVTAELKERGAIQ